MARIVVEEGDITQAATDAIVNAANTQLVLGSGVAGAIRLHGGDSIQEECDAHGPVALGEIAVTGAGKLACRFVIHAAAMDLGGSVDEASLRSVTGKSLRAAVERGLASIAFPAIGTGVGGFPLQRCAEVMLSEVHGFLETDDRLHAVHFVLFGEPAYRVFEQVRDAEKIRVQLDRLRRAKGASSGSPQT